MQAKQNLGKEEHCEVHGGHVQRGYEALQCHLRSIFTTNPLRNQKTVLQNDPCKPLHGRHFAQRTWENQYIIITTGQHMTYIDIRYCKCIACFGDLHVLNGRRIIDLYTTEVKRTSSKVAARFLLSKKWLPYTSKGSLDCFGTYVFYVHIFLLSFSLFSLLKTCPLWIFMACPGRSACLRGGPPVWAFCGRARHTWVAWNRTPSVNTQVMIGRIQSNYYATKSNVTILSDIVQQDVRNFLYLLLCQRKQSDYWHFTAVGA